MGSDRPAVDLQHLHQGHERRVDIRLHDHPERRLERNVPVRPSVAMTTSRTEQGADPWGRLLAGVLIRAVPKHRTTNGHRFLPSLGPSEDTLRPGAAHRPGHSLDDARHERRMQPRTRYAKSGDVHIAY